MLPARPLDWPPGPAPAYASPLSARLGLRPDLGAVAQVLSAQGCVLGEGGTLGLLRLAVRVGMGVTGTPRTATLLSLQPQSGGQAGAGQCFLEGPRA